MGSSLSAEANPRRGLVPAWLFRRGLVVPLAVVSAQMLVNFETGRISDLRKLYFVHHLYTHPFPYVGTSIEYPVLTGVFMTTAAALTHGVAAYMRLSSLGLWACALGSTAVLWRLSRRAAWCFALCPLLLVYSLLNWDLLAIFLMLLGWQAWTRNRYRAAAVFLALGTFAKLYPIFLFVFCVVELARRRRSGLATRRDMVHFLLTALAVTAAVNVPFMVLAFHRWAFFWSFNAARNEHAGLLFWLHILNHASSGTTNSVLAALVLSSVAIGALAAWRGARVADVAAAAFCVFMLLQKVYSPQYTLWIVAFALIAGWDLWTICLLSMMGLTDYASALIHIALVSQHSSFVFWYQNQIMPLDQGLRLLTTLTVMIAMTHRAARHRLVTRASKAAHDLSRTRPLQQSGRA